MTNDDLDPIQFKKDVRYIRLLEKRLVKKPEESKQLQRRTLHSALAVLRCLKDVPFSDFSRTLYFLCVDSKTDEFTRYYEAQLELALIDEEKFVKNLHKFYSEMSKRIRDEDLFSRFFQFMSFFCIKRYNYNATTVHRAVSDSYVNLLLQQTEYLRPEKYNLKQRVMGLSTKGELILADDFMPFLDNITNTMEYEAIVKNSIHGQAAFQQRFMELLRAYGLPVLSEDDYNEIAQKDRLFTNTSCVMSPYINEYTFDILPTADNTLSANVYKLSLLTTDLNLEELKDKLKHRARTLPSNGVVFSLEPQSAQIVRMVKLKEVLFGDEIIMLYKVTTCIGETSGFYNTNTGIFFNVLADVSLKSIYENMQCFILYLYCCAVLRDGKGMLGRMKDVVSFINDRPGDPLIDYEVNTALLGGKPRDVYHRGEAAERRFDAEKYQYEERQIQGFIRKLPMGHHASAEAMDRAKLLGFDLEDNETYVQGFVKNVPCLKEKI